jgi:hypothetical protein
LASTLLQKGGNIMKKEGAFKLIFKPSLKGASATIVIQKLIEKRIKESLKVAG